ncbi:MAG: 7-cyano-7-deazaguanine synthase QueC [Peptococcaceae bacterium]|nr:7-cyano-7-deazaguanine synthase QueC [Peptococcaceae bacterium]
MSSIVLLSGGLDSTVSLGQALREGEVELCLTFDYGQRARLNEIKAAAEIAAHYKLKHRVVQLPFLKEITATSLVNPGADVPEPGDEDFNRPEVLAGTARSVWVPNRNGVFINIAASFAEALDCSQIVTGFNAEEAKTFPDNSREYLAACNQALSLSTLKRVRVVSYTLMLDKVEIITLGRRLGAPLRHVWPCYHGGEQICGRCESCRRYLRALQQADS